MKPRPLFSVVLAIAVFLPCPSQLTAQGTRADYDRALGLAKATENKVFRARFTPRWFADNTRFWYRVDTAPGRHEFVLVDAGQGTRQPAFDHERLARSLGNKLGRALNAQQLPIDRLEFGDGGTMQFLSEGKRWRCDLQTYALTEGAADTANGSTARRIAEPRPSLRTGAETTLTFVNRTRGDVQLFWIDSEGQRQSYGTVRAGDRREQHTYEGHVWLVTTTSGERLAVFEATAEVSEAVIDGAPARPDDAAPRADRPRRPRSRGTSPDGAWTVSITNHNVRVRSLATGTDQDWTTDGTAEDGYTAQFFWSPDSRRLVVMRVKAGDARKVNLLESSPRDQLQPKLITISYAKPGDRVDVARPVLFDAPTGRVTPVSTELFPNPWSVSEVRWAADSSRFTFLYNQRGHQVLRLVGVDAATGEARSVIEDESRTFIDYSGKQFLHAVEGTNEFVWMSERDGWNHLYLYEGATGKVKNQVTRGAWVVRGVERVDDARREIWFRAGGIRAGQDPYYVHLCRVNFDGSGLVVLTEGDGTHEVEFSPDRRFLIDRWSRVDQPAITELRRAADGKRICELERADAGALLEAGWKAPERFVAKGRDGATDIFGIIIRPSTFDAAKRYPVIEEIYAGPQGAFVPKSFGLQLRQHAIAELGFIVVQIDGMGTSHRSKAFHDVCWKNLGDSGFPDRILWLKAAAAKYPQMDLSRVGVYGGSAGGQSALRALLAYGDFYKVAVADCGCHDNRMDKIWWNEQWMGWPIGPHYEEQSNVTQAHKLQGRLLLTVAELDRNVDPASTLQVVNALIKANKDFDMLLVPGAGHGVGETPYLSRRRMDFFVRHLLGVEPRS